LQDLGGDGKFKRLWAQKFSDANPLHKGTEKKGQERWRGRGWGATDKGSGL